VEIERKFMVGEPPGLEGTEWDDIEQGYLALGPSGEVRLRRRSERLELTVKRGGGLSREESEIEIDRDQFDALWPLTDGRRLTKRRHRIGHGELTIELDVYGGGLEGLIVAEVEFESESDADSFIPPDWFGTEVTDDHRYRNGALATDGAP
jgi:adenylate cyclase